TLRLQVALEVLWRQVAQGLQGVGLLAHAGTSVGATSVPASTRVTKRVRMGSLCAASRIASLATSGETPAISNSILPGLITATHPSGEPLPEPMRVSAGFLVYDLSGKTRIQIWPPRRTWRVMARRAASICRLVIQQTSSACRP